MAESAEGSSSHGVNPLALVLGLGVIYVVWGSTYLAIRVGVETMPPFLMAGARFLIAGTILFAWALLRGSPLPVRVHWRFGAITGALMLLCGNGGVVWAEKTVPSGMAALLITTTPLWMALCDWLRPGGVRPPLAVWFGLIAGFIGTAALVSFGGSAPGEGIAPWGVFALVAASLTWALGSVIAKHSPRPSSPVMATAVQMLCGGVMLVLVGGLAGELRGFNPAEISRKSWLGFAYLLIVGSLFTMTIYTWLLHVTEPTLIATYAFVNPIIAVLLGWLLADETLTQSTIIAGIAIVAAVAWLVAVQWRFASKPGAIRRRQRLRMPQEAST